MSTVIPAYAGNLGTLVNELVLTRSTIGVRLYTLDHGTTIDSRTHLRSNYLNVWLGWETSS